MDNSFPSDKWYDPPEQHELDICEGCHLEGYHEDAIYTWADYGCLDCQELLYTGETGIYETPSFFTEN